MNRETLICRYHYDPLDRLADCTSSALAGTQRFYLNSRLTSEIQGSAQRSIFQQDDQLLAQQQRQDSVVETTLLTTDQQRSVMHALDATKPCPLVYTPYGHRPAENGLLSLLGFNGERPDPVTGHYLLGNGYRAFNSVLMRFNSPDSSSPFGEGGLNAYAYCGGDPVNRNDPTGHFWNIVKGFQNMFLGRIPQNARPAPGVAPPTNLPASKTKTGTPKRSLASSASLATSGTSVDVPLTPTPRLSTISEISSNESIYTPILDRPSATSTSIQSRPFPPPPSNARLQTEWSDPPPTILNNTYQKVEDIREDIRRVRLAMEQITLDAQAQARWRRAYRREIIKHELQQW